jgi:formylglycine-generating enzyme required for sulfatase activity
MKFYQIFGLMFLSVGLRGQEPDMKRQLKMVLEKYAEHWSYFVAQDTRGKGSEVPRKFAALFTPTAQIYNQNSEEVLSSAEYMSEIHNFSVNTTLIIKDRQFCRQDALFYIYYQQGYNGDCLHCETKDLPALYYRMSVVKSGEKWLISNIELSPTQARSPDADNDGIPNDCDVCPNTVGTLEYFGDDPYNSCKKPKPKCIEPETVLVRGGTFQMGSNDGDSDEKPVHTVTVSPFQMGKYEVTNAQFCAFLNEKGNQTEADVTWIDLPGSYDDERCRIQKLGGKFEVERGYENYPVIYVNYYGAVAYCQWLSECSGKKYRLPTEAEWEYAAGNGSRHTKYSWGDGLPNGSRGGNVADETAKKKYSSWSIFDNYSDNYVYTAPVGQFLANDFGLYDMTGNVWEWCSDWKGDYSSAAVTNPSGAVTGSYRVLRGGSWDRYPLYARVACRSGYTPTCRSNLIGFRVAFIVQ